jgi:ADP-dependent NAD(P)H-hydrate dehydratase / NAD(P)H-hydrate epimerase
MYLCDSTQIRKADQTMAQGFEFPGLLLMETAGRKSADWILAHYPDRRLYLILAGPGNNGGDGLVISRYLHLAGKSVAILLSHPPEHYQGDALVNWNALKGANVPHGVWPCELPADYREHPQECLLIDALLGTGIQGKLKGAAATLIAAFGETGAPVVAIDLPSGLNADTGRIENAPIRATATLTFQCPKICHYLIPAANACGEVTTLDIGIWPKVMASLGIKRHLLDSDACRAIYHQRPSDGHKGVFGHALLVGGSRAYAGAIALSGMAALATGAGLATIFTTESARCAAYGHGAELMVKAWGTQDTAWLSAEALPEFRDACRGKHALAIGPGLGNEPETCTFMQGVLQAWAQPLVIDADGLNMLSSEPELWRHVPQGSILTPHPGELARLLPGKDVHDERLEMAEHLALQKQVVVVLKGKGTVIAFPDGKTYVNTSGNAGMATGGSGDVLTGMLAALLAQGYPPPSAALLGVFLHGLAGDICAEMTGSQESVTASGILAAIGAAFQAMHRSGSDEALASRITG